MAERVPFDGLVLAGGKARRFGRDKRIESFDGETLAGRAVRKLTFTGASTVFIATGPRVERLPGASRAVALRDEPPECGPLGGICAALLRSRFDVLVLAVDLPLIGVRTLRNLVQLGQGRSCPVALRSARGWEPLVAYYPRTVLKDVRAAIQQGSYAPHKLLARLGAISIAPASKSETLNVNTPEDLNSALREAGNLSGE